MGMWKIPSGEITDLPYLKKIGAFNERVFLSTGMSELKEIQQAIAILVEAGTNRHKISILHCNTEYPTPMHDVNLKAMITIRNETGLNVGYSDHTPGIEVPIAAVAMGARIIEKHFTLDRTLPGPDHRSSLEPGELKQMVSAIRNVEMAMGNGIKQPSPSEYKNIAVARKSIHLKSDLIAGSVLKEEHLMMKLPGDGISPMRMTDLLGKKTRRDLAADHKLSMDDFL